MTSARPGVNSDFGWPTFLYKGAGGHAFFDVIFGFPQYQTLVLLRRPSQQPKQAAGADGSEWPGPEEEEELVAVGYATPCVWGGSSLEDLPPTWDHVIVTARRMLADPASAPTPTAMSALAVEGRGLSQIVLGHMKVIARAQGAKGLLAPIRPILKPQYPLVDMEQYITWHVPDPKRPGQEVLFDPWLRTHVRLGARILQVSRGSATVYGSVAEWEEWTGMRFISSGPYTVPGGLVVLEVDREGDAAVYREDNVWVAHTLLPDVS
ncbi:hypothetical protein HYH03_007163 [Edaphochlamys debaryana]|uniref:Uncharacterized protein n=1 Tax=Edaphochlamys debaryana TaxID=47281 RepID=A0A835Y3R6_9CHLO|nr:hypothetical protein HYH03_007163 [Edaphochlamys debaryana]|eukprot:KAG2494647.1 hypothetical protein HYH03_007163 [Edaphochlamys debaryana]